RLGDRRPEHLPRVHQRAVQDPPRDQEVAENLTLAAQGKHVELFHGEVPESDSRRDRKSTRLNSSHVSISYAVFCLKKKKTKQHSIPRFFVPAPHTTFTLAHVLFPPPSPPAIQAPNAPGASPYTSLPIHPDSS